MALAEHYYRKPGVIGGVQLGSKLAYQLVVVGGTDHMTGTVDQAVDLETDPKHTKYRNQYRN